MAGVKVRRGAGDRADPADPADPAPAAQPDHGTGGDHRMSAALLWGGLFSLILWAAIFAAIF